MKKAKPLNFLQLLLFGTRRPKATQRNRAPKRPTMESGIILIEIWKRLRIEYFPDRADIDSYSVGWSRRSQRRTLASCNIDRRRVVVARELRGEECRRWLEPLLYHEMCHAVLGKDVEYYRSKRAWHGREFRDLERRHAGTSELDAWIRSGGWRRAVLRDRALATWAKRRAA